MSFDPSGSVSSENNLSYLNQEDQVKPIVVRAQRSPLTSDRRYKIGTLWINQVANSSFQLTSVAAGIANWVLLGVGAGDLETLTGDGGGAISPDGAGDIILAGGTNLTTAGAGNTITTNLDANITLTSVTATNFETDNLATGLTVSANSITADGTDVNIRLAFIPKGLSHSEFITGDIVATAGSVTIATAGQGVDIAEGANARMGIAILIAGTLTVATTAVTANSRIFLTSQVDGGTPGFLRISGRNAAVDFTITSGDGADTSTVAWLIMEPA